MHAEMSATALQIFNTKITPNVSQCEITYAVRLEKLLFLSTNKSMSTLYIHQEELSSQNN